MPSGRVGKSRIRIEITGISWYDNQMGKVDDRLKDIERERRLGTKKNCAARNGFFISFEGTEGSGKTTQVRLLVEFLLRQHKEVISTREPGGTTFGCQLREILLTGGPDKISPTTETFLYCADRAHHIQSLILPALEDGKFVICDRFADATMAYQGWGRGLPIEELQEINSFACGGVLPDLTILINIDPDKGLRRAIGRNQKNLSVEDRFEKEKLDFHRRVLYGYMSLANANPHRFRVISGEGTPQEVHHKVVETITDYL